MSEIRIVFLGTPFLSPPKASSLYPNYYIKKKQNISFKKKKDKQK